MSSALTIFVVEDEPLIQEVLTDALEDQGFSVLCADSAESALGLLEEKIGVLSALITDIDLGQSDITGWDVSRRGRELNSELPVIYMTGASAHEWPSKGVPQSVLLTKPFAPVQMVTALAQLLNDAAQLRALASPAGEPEQGAE